MTADNIIIEALETITEDEWHHSDGLCGDCPAYVSATILVAN